jgi:hypothetical protein
MADLDPLAPSVAARFVGSGACDRSVIGGIDPELRLRHIERLTRQRSSPITARLTPHRERGRPHRTRPNDRARRRRRRLSSGSTLEGLADPQEGRARAHAHLEGSRWRGPAPTRRRAPLRRARWSPRRRGRCSPDRSCWDDAPRYAERAVVAPSSPWTLWTTNTGPKMSASPSAASMLARSNSSRSSSASATVFTDGHTARSDSRATP